jgi:hypothetical protein
MKNVMFKDVAVEANFAWHGHPYVKFSLVAAHPIEKDNKPSLYEVEVCPLERVVVA